MKAVVKFKGKQFVVKAGDVLVVDRLQSEPGSDIAIESVSMIEDQGNVTLGVPLINGAKVSATVRRHLRGPKITIFKKNIRKRYQKTQGHRQDLTELVIGQISL